MLQKCVILGLVFLLAGGAAFAWLHRETQDERRQAQSAASANSLGSQDYLEKYGRWYQLSPEQQNQLVLELDNERKSKTATQLAQEQQARLWADLDKLAARQMHPGDIADFLYGPGWESQVEQHKKHREEMETVRTIAITCLSTGGVLFGGCATLWLLGLLVRATRALTRRSGEPEPETETPVLELTDIELHDLEPQTGPEAPAPGEQPRQRRKVLSLSEAPGESVSELPSSMDDLFHAVAAGAETGLDEGAQAATRAGWSSPTAYAALEDGGAALLLTDEPSHGGGWSPEAQWSLNCTPEVASENAPQEQHSMRRSTLPQPDRESVSTVENPLNRQAEDLQKQIAEFRQMAQNVQQATREQSAPLSNTLKELTEQVSAIREYAASQQGRVEKLQDGYDWGIIRTFCLRVIRCIDNLEGRLADLPKDDSATQHLEEVRDELLFALESSGVEPFRPEINSEFHGQERLAEALKEKQPAKKPEQAGKIARVIRPGYRYMMDDDNYRVVRTAQVKIYG